MGARRRQAALPGPRRAGLHRRARQKVGPRQSMRRASMTMTIEEIKDQVVWLTRRDGNNLNTLENMVRFLHLMSFLLQHCERQGASFEMWEAALELADKQLRDEPKAK